MDFTKVIEWFEATSLYKDLLSKLPEPLNNSVFAGIVLLILGILVIWSIADYIGSVRIRRRIKRKSREYEEREIENKLKAAEEKAQNDEINKCLQVMMVTQMQNMVSTRESMAEKQKTSEGCNSANGDVTPDTSAVSRLPDESVLKE